MNSLIPHQLRPMCVRLLAITMIATLPLPAQSQDVFSGIYPHLAFFNNEQECGTGAVVPWAGRLWVVTYAPHAPEGSSDKLYEITPELKLIVRPESIGGTPANRMIHRESNQLFIGPYVIDAERNVRVIPYSQMFGRPTGNARHLEDPASKVYVATMEEGFYEVDVDTLAVTTLYHDQHLRTEPKASLPGYHGKGLYSGQGRLVYANNGEQGKQAKLSPFVPSGALTEWNGSTWKVVLRQQFTEVTGPGGIYGNSNPRSDPIWSIGWDAKSLILMLLDHGKWHRFRLPKASHSYDGAHGWNTEWPRIRDIGEERLLMTMHGMFWHFPRTFTASNTAGIAPRSTYLKVIGDFCRWQDKVVFGCDDTARSEFLNTRRAKGKIAPPQSHSNLWFVNPEQLDQFGPVIGRGAVWLNDKVVGNKPSDPFLVSGFGKRAVHLVTDGPSTITFEVDFAGKGEWVKLGETQVDGYHWHAFDDSLDATWMRLRSSESLQRATAWFHFSGDDVRTAVSAKFAGVARPGDAGITGGIVRARDKDERTLQFAAADAVGRIGTYILDSEMSLRTSDDPQDWNWLQRNAAIASRTGVLEVDAASVIYTDDNGMRYRLPKSPDFVTVGPLGFDRLCREVATERDLFNCHGTFYELPANNAGGFPKIRPVCTHNLQVMDYCSYRGLLVLSGINLDAAEDNPHIIHSDDRRTAIWVGAIDDIWELGKPVGRGGPWLNSAVQADEVSDPFLMTGYDRKSLELSSVKAAAITVEVDISGMGDWCTYDVFHVKAGQRISHDFPDGFEAYWIRVMSDKETRATAQLLYR